MTQPRTADAVDRPCQVRLSHNPLPIRTQSHHRFPVYLQMRLWGEVRLEDRWDACGTDHDSIHAWVGALLGEQRKPRRSPGRLVVAEARRVVAWYQSELAKLPGSRAYGEGAYGSGAYGSTPDQRQPDAEWDGIE